MRRLDILLVLVAIAALVGLGAGMAASPPLPPLPTASLEALPSPSPARELVEGTVGPVITLDPLFASTPAERSIAALLFRGLTRLGPGSSVEPDLATSWAVDDGGSAYTFRMRTDVHWHDRRLVTADDVVATWTTLTDPAYDGPAAGRWTGVTVERVDRFTVRFLLPVPLASFLTAMTQPIVPAHILAEVPLAERTGHPFALEPIGNGPFELASLEGDAALLVRVGPRPGGVAATFRPGPLAAVPEPTPHRAGPRRPWLDRYRVRIHPDQAALAEAFDSGAVDVAAGLAPADAERLSREDGVAAIHYPGTRVAALIPNLRFTAPQLDDAAVRRGLSSAIDRDAIVTSVYGDAATSVGTPVSPAAPVFDPIVSSQPAHDPEAARAAFRAAGWTESPDGWRGPEATETVELELLVRDPAVDPLGWEVAGLVAEDWRAVGLGVEVVAVPPQELVEERLRPGRFEIALLDLEIGLDPDLHALLVSSEAVVGGTNIGAYQSSLMDWLLDAARLTADGPTRLERFRELQAALAREMPIIPLVFPDEVMLVRGTLSGAAPRALEETGDRYWDVLAWLFAFDPDE